MRGSVGNVKVVSFVSGVAHQDQRKLRKELPIGQ